MKRASVVLISLLLLFSFCFLAYGNQEGRTSSTFQQKPITRGICEDTAYTLKQGGLKLGNLTAPGQLSQWKNAYLKYGLTDNLQVGSAIPQNFLGRPNLSGKYRLTSNRHGGVDLAIPASLSMYLGSTSNVSFSSGLAASWDTDDKFSFHGGANLVLSSFRFFSPSAYLMTDYNLLSNLKLISELSLHAFSADVLTIRAGGLMRPLDFLNLKFSSSFDLPTGDMSAWASLFVRI